MPNCPLVFHPQVHTAPPAPTASPPVDPAATAVIPLKPGSWVGERTVGFELHPAFPWPLYPQPQTFPPAPTANPFCPPAAMRVIPESPAMTAGTSKVVSGKETDDPFPKQPFRLYPQDQTVPSPLRTRVESSPVATASGELSAAGEAT